MELFKILENVFDLFKLGRDDDRNFFCWELEFLIGFVCFCLELDLGLDCFDMSIFYCVIKDYKFCKILNNFFLNYKSFFKNNSSSYL